jgi:hypothetical protein
MSALNKKRTGSVQKALKAAEPKQIINPHGLVAYKAADEVALYKYCSSIMVGNKTFYKGPSTRDFQTLCSRVSVDYLLALAAYVRNEMDMRSTAVMLLVEAAKRKHEANTPNPVRAYTPYILTRMDQPAEAISYFAGEGKLEKFPNALRRGIADTITMRGNHYNIAKYKRASRDVSLVDVFNLCHPQPKNEKQAEVFKSLIEGTLKDDTTWEAKLSKNGSEGKDTLWNEIAPTMSLMVLVKNLRNFLQAGAYGAIQVTVDKLKDPKEVKNSRLWPHEFYKAYLALVNEAGIKLTAPLKEALSIAIDLATENIPRIKGSTLIALDVSGSMKGNQTNAGLSPAQIGCVLLNALEKVVDGKVLLVAYDGNARVITLPKGNALTRIESVVINGGMTNHTSVIELAQKQETTYDNIFMFTDEVASWNPDSYSGGSSYQTWLNYRKRNKNARLITVNLVGTTFSFVPDNARGVTNVAGFSKAIFDQNNTESSDAVIDYIKERWSLANLQESYKLSTQRA